MRYTFRMVFHGIMAIVKDRDCYHVIVPDTRRGSWDEKDLKEEKALDKTPLLRHLPKLDNQRLEGVRISVEGLPASDFEPHPSLETLPRMKAVVGESLTALDRYYWSVLRQTGSNPPPSNNMPPAVLACLTIDRGRLFAGGGCAADLPGLLHPNGGQSGLMATIVTWEVGGVANKVTVCRSPLSGPGQSRCRSYGPPQAPKSHISLKLRNECQEPGHNLSHPGHSRNDPDFKWYYSMLAKRAEVGNEIANPPTRELPYPVARATCPEIKLLGNIEGVNCRPCLFE